MSLPRSYEQAIGTAPPPAPYRNERRTPMKLVARLLPAPAAIIILSAVAPARQLQIKTHTLKNGVKIIGEEDHSIPNVAL